MSNQIRVLLVDDELLVCAAIAALLQLDERLKVVGMARNAVLGLQKAQTLRPDVILLDLHLPDQSGIDVIGDLLRANPGVRVVILTAYADAEEVAAAFRAGAVGYVLKTQAEHDLVRAIDQAYQGLATVPPQVASVLLRALQPAPPCAPTLGELSKAERRVLLYVAQGLKNQEIAERLEIGVPTVHTHINHILAKLGLKNRTQAAIYALEHGLVARAGPLMPGSSQ
jgi:DNA-binding NarL/FixJ family response regulator